MRPVRKIEGEGRKVLVVDDDLAIRVLLDAVLKRMGFNVMLAQDGRRALELLERYEYDLLLLDLLMPIVDGYEVLDRLRPERHLPVIVFTGVDDDGIPSDRVCQALRKPFDLELFCETVARCLDSTHRSRGEASPLPADAER